MERVILHCDLNNFYASVECLYNPAIRNKPVAVGGDVEQRHGIILAKNYLAKKFGVQTGEALWQAKKKCPEIIIVPPNYKRYLKYSQMTRDIYNEYTDQVESFGLDECWLDVSGSTNLFGSGKQIADEIRKRITFELGVTASVGVSFNKIFAKLGSDMKKPDATTIITKDNFKDTVWNLPVSDLLYVGRSTNAKLLNYGIDTIGSLAKTDEKFIKSILGKNGLMLYAFANGWDISQVATAKAESYIKSIGNSTTTPHDLITDEDVKITLYVLAESVAARLREQGLKCKTVQISVRDSELYSYERQTKLQQPVCTSTPIFEKAFYLYKEHRTDDKPIRSIGVRACDLTTLDDIQLSLLEDISVLENQQKLESTVDVIRRRFGHFSVQRGIMLIDRHLSKINPKGDHVIHPEAFLR